MTHKIIDIARDFSKFPGGRVLADGPYSGERFREEFLIPALEHNDQVTVIIDGTLGYGSSFLEECFGGLIRKNFAPEELKKRITIQSEKPAFEIYKNEIWDFINARE